MMSAVCKWVTEVGYNDRLREKFVSIYRRDIVYSLHACRLIIIIIRSSSSIFNVA